MARMATNTDNLIYFTLCRPRMSIHAGSRLFFAVVFVLCLNLTCNAGCEATYQLVCQFFEVALKAEQT